MLTEHDSKKSKKKDTKKKWLVISGSDVLVCDEANTKPKKVFSLEDCKKVEGEEVIYTNTK